MQYIIILHTALTCSNCSRTFQFQNLLKLQSMCLVIKGQAVILSAHTNANELHNCTPNPLHAPTSSIQDQTLTPGPAWDQLEMLMFPLTSLFSHHFTANWNHYHANAGLEQEHKQHLDGNAQANLKHLCQKVCKWVESLFVWTCLTHCTRWWSTMYKNNRVIKSFKEQKELY